MEDVLDIYSWEYDETHPVVCMDEQPTQLVKETRQPLPGRRGTPKRYDFEYERNGMANSFLFTEPLAGWRKVSVRETKTKKDWATEVKPLLDDDYPDAELVILVCDNLNTTHPFGALYIRSCGGEAACGPPGYSSYPEARQLAEHGRNRTERHDSTVSDSSHSRCCHPPPRNEKMGCTTKYKSNRNQLAIQNRQGTNKTEVPVPTNTNDVKY